MSAATTPVRALCAAFFFATAVPFAATAAPATCPPKVATTADGWRRAAAPSFAAGDAQVVAYAVRPADAGTMYATNGVAVARTRDGGCSWTASYTLPEMPSAEAPFSRDTADIVDVVAGNERVYVVLRDQLSPRVLVSSDGGSSWRLASIPAVHTGLAWQPPQLVADATGMRAYLLADATGGLLMGNKTTTTLWATSDGGNVWSSRTVGVTGAVVDLRTLAVDPLSGKDLWLTSSNGLLHSPDGGVNWDAARPVGDSSLGPLSVVHRPGEPVQIAAASIYEAIAYLRGAAGAWTIINTPGIVASLAGGRAATQAAITTESGVYELNYAALTWQPVHRGRPMLQRLSTDASPTYHACACGFDGDGSLWSRAPRPVTQADRDAEDDRGVDETLPPPPGEYPGTEGCAPRGKHRAVPEPDESAVTPAGNQITLAPGQSVTVPYRFRVRPRELDVYFLADTGPRSIEFGCAAKQGVVWAADTLARGRNLRVGAGEYRDYARGQDLFAIISPQCVDLESKDFVYRRNLRIGAVDDQFRKGVAEGGAYGACTGDFAGLTGLLHATTGEGRDVLPEGRSEYDIAPGQAAGFARGAYKVIVHIAGGWLDNPSRTPGYPGPDFSEVIEALASRGIKQVGLYVPPDQKKYHGTDPRPQESGRDDLTRVADGTDTFAQRDVVCNTRLKAVVRVGKPLVCTFLLEADPRGKDGVLAPPMGRQIADLVASLADVRPMRLAVLSGDGVVTKMAPDQPKRLDHLLAQTLAYSVTFKCGAGELGASKRVELGGLVGNDVVASATTTVRCGTPPVVPTLPRPAIVPPVPVPVHVAAPVGNPVPNPNPAPNPATQPQAQSQPVAQGVVVPQEQGQPQLAVAHQATTEQVGTQYEMSALRRRSARDAVPRWLLAELAALVTCATAVVSFAGRTQWARAGRRTPR